MQETMPQEIEVRYILPAIRRELANTLIQEHKLSQKDAAAILGLTEAAVSQYRHSKRAREVVFSADVIDEIRKSAGKIMLSKSNRHVFMAEMNRISSLMKVRHIVCDLHRSQSKDLEKCNVCFEGNLLSIKNVND